MAPNYLVPFVYLVVTVAAVVSGTAKRPGFIFLGSTKEEFIVKVDGITSVPNNDKSYWISVNSAGYSDAKRDCKANGDDILQIETDEELQLIEEWLRNSNQSSSSAWVGAKYHVKSNSFTWENGETVLDGMWADGQPSYIKPNSRVVASLVGQIVQLKSQARTQTTRYICEGL